MNRFFRWSKREFLHIFPVFIFFFVMFCLVNLADSFLLRKAGLPSFSYLSILIAATVVAKILLVLDHLPFINLSHRYPLIAVIFWKTFLYWLITLLVRACIRFTPFLFSQKSLWLDFESYIDQVDWGFFFSIQAWYLMLFFIFVAGRELTRAIGHAKMMGILFKKK